MSRKEDGYIDVGISVKFVFRNVHKESNPIEKVEETFVDKMKQALRYGGAGNDRLFGLSDVLFCVDHLSEWNFDLDCRNMEKINDGLFVEEVEDE